MNRRHERALQCECGLPGRMLNRHLRRTRHQVPPGRQDLLWRFHLFRLSRLAALERRTVHVADMMTDPTFSPTPIHRTENARTVLSVPMLRENRLVGVITTWRREVRLFSEKQVDLVETFADQAVIALENVRLFQELRESLEQQTATSEILGVIASSPTDLQPVLDAIAQSAARVCGSDDATIRLVEAMR